MGNDKEGKDPFMAEGPHLLDIGIMGRCKRADVCTLCYQNASTEGINMDIKDYVNLLDQTKNTLLQVALGGAGSPDEHPQFAEIIQETRARGIVPNYTTSGWDVTPQIAELTKKYCGAVAVSWYNEDIQLKAINEFLKQECITNLHFVLHKNSIEEAMDILEGKHFHSDLFAKLNAIVFLLFKPIGKGSPKLKLEYDHKLSHFLEIVEEGDYPFKVGFDSCSVPALISSIDVNPILMEACEGGRFSAYVHSDLTLKTCSFDVQNKFSVSLKENDFKTIWGGEKFNSFRNLMKTCTGCPKTHCLGACVLHPEITLCKFKEQKLYGG